MCSLVWCLRNNYTFAAMDFGRRLGASDEHIPQWICKERATTPPPKRHAALRVALKLAWGFVAQSVEYRCGYTPSFAPRPRPISAQRMYSYFGDTTPDRYPASRAGGKARQSGKTRSLGSRQPAANRDRSRPEGFVPVGKNCN